MDENKKSTSVNGGTSRSGKGRRRPDDYTDSSSAAAGRGEPKAKSGSFEDISSDRELSSGRKDMYKLTSEPHTAVFTPVKREPKAEEPENEEVSENRRKSDRRFWVRFFSLAAIIPVYLALLVCTVFLPRSTVSNIEKRNLATFPEFTWDSYWDGSYTAGIANYFDDTVPNRDPLKQTAGKFMNLLGIKYNDVQVTGTMELVKVVDDDDDEEYEDGSSSGSYGGSIGDGTKKKKKKTGDDNQVKGEEIADGVYANGIIVVKQDGHYRAMSMYGGGSGDTFAAAVNNYADDLPGVRVYSLVAPTASEYYTPENFQDYNASQEEDIIDINDKLQNATGINVCPELLRHKKENIYTRTDHHWSALGAYYAAEEFADTAGVDFYDISEYTKQVKPDYVGTLYAFSDNNADLLSDPEDFVYYVPKKQNYTVQYYDQAFNVLQFEGGLFADVEITSEYYSTFIYGDAFSSLIKTGVKNGRRCLIIRDSYGGAFVPFLTGSFEEIYAVDMRYFERNIINFVRENNITDVLFMCCSYSAVGPNADYLEEKRTSGIMGGSVGKTDTSNTTAQTSSEEPEEVESEEEEERTGNYVTADYFTEDSEYEGVGIYRGDDDGGGDDGGGEDDYSPEDVYDEDDW